MCYMKVVVYLMVLLLLLLMETVLFSDAANVLTLVAMPYNGDSHSSQWTGINKQITESINKGHHTLRANKRQNQRNSQKQQQFDLF